MYHRRSHNVENHLFGKTCLHRSMRFEYVLHLGRLPFVFVGGWSTQKRHTSGNGMSKRQNLTLFQRDLGVDTDTKVVADG